MSNVRSYTDEQLLDRVASLPDFKGFPASDKYWGIGVASEENAIDQFDDKFYLFKGEKFITVASKFTTNSGTYGLKNFYKWNKDGCFVMETNHIYYNFWRTNHKHKGRMRAWGQRIACWGYRDANKNSKAEETGKRVFGIFGINFHTATYRLITFIRRLIGAWSVGCQVVSDTKKYYSILDLVDPNQSTVTYAILREWDPQTEANKSISATQE